MDSDFSVDLGNAVLEMLDKAAKDYIENSDYDDLIKEAAQNYNFDTDIQDAVRDYDFSDDIADAVNDHDFTDAIEKAVRDFDWDEYIKDALNEGEFGQHVGIEFEKYINSEEFKKAVHACIWDQEFGRRVQDYIPREPQLNWFGRLLRWFTTV